jgi:hypothetical protein
VVVRGNETVVTEDVRFGFVEKQSLGARGASAPRQRHRLKVIDCRRRDNARRLDLYRDRVRPLVETGRGGK